MIGMNGREQEYAELLVIKMLNSVIESLKDRQTEGRTKRRKYVTYVRTTQTLYETSIMPIVGGGGGGGGGKVPMCMYVGMFYLRLSVPACLHVCMYVNFNLLQ